MINADEIAGILKQQISSFNYRVQERSRDRDRGRGRTWRASTGFAACAHRSWWSLPTELQGVALNLEEDNVGAVLMGDDER